MARRPEYTVPGFLAREKAAYEAKERERARSIERRVLRRAFAGFVAAAKARKAASK